MNMIKKSVWAGLATVVLGLCISAGAIAQQKAASLKQQILGSWMLQSVYDEFEGGKKENPWGAGVQGTAMYDRSGRFSYMIVSAGRGKSETGPRTPVGQAIGYFGTYTTNDADKTITWKIERSTFPNFEGIERTATITIKGDSLSQVSAPIPSPAGKFSPHIEWKKVK
jgi:hypothetical protein